MFFPEDSHQPDHQEESETSLTSRKACTNSSPSSAITRSLREDECLKSKNVHIRKSRGLLLKQKQPAQRKEPTESSPTPKGFQKLKDEDSILGSPTTEIFCNLGHGIRPISAFPLSTIESVDTVEVTTSDDQTCGSTDQETAGSDPPTMDQHEKSQSYLSETGQRERRVGKNKTFEDDNSISYTETNSTRGQDLSQGGEEKEAGCAEEGKAQKCSNDDGTEFRQFVFDKKFSRIETVAVEKSNSGTADRLISAAATLASKLRANANDRYPATSTFSSPQQGVNKKVSNRLLSPGSVASRFPSPRFPSPEEPKQTDAQSKSKSQRNSVQRKKRNMNKDSEEQSVNFGMEAGSRTHGDVLVIPPKAILTSSEFTVVSNMSATHVTSESYNRTEKSPVHQPSALMTSGGEEQQDEDPFNSANAVDDALWEADGNNLFSNDKTKIKYQGGSLKKSNSSDDSLIASIRMATKRENGPTAKKPDPSPRAMRTMRSAGDSGRKWVLESSEEARERSSRKKRTPLRSQEKPGAEFYSPARKLFPDTHVASTLVESLSPQQKGNKSAQMPANGGGSPTPSCASVSEKEKLIEGKRNFRLLSPHKTNNTPLSPRQSGSTLIDHDVVPPQRQQHSHGNGAMNPGTTSPKSIHGILPLPSSIHNSSADPFGSSCTPPTQSKLDYYSSISAAIIQPAPIGPDSDDLENIILNEEGYTSSTTRPVSPSSCGKENDSNDDAEKEKLQQPWQFLGSGEKSIQTNPSGVPTSAIAASMLFQAGPTQSSRTLGANAKEEDADDGVDEDLPEVPPAVHVTDSIDAVSSITEEASSFYHKSFQLWSKTAHNALNNIQRGTFTRNPSQYRAHHS